VHTPTVDVLQTALDKQALPVPKIHTSPKTQTYVQLATSFWIGQAQFRDVTATATVPDQTVTVTATKQSVTWNLGEATRTCTGPAATTQGLCTYTYLHSSADRPGKAYQVTATITWSVHWTCTGTCDSPGGDLGVTQMSSPAFAFPVREIQTESVAG
jgi:hypothetical protein